MSLFMVETIVTAVVTTLALAALQFDPVCNGTDIPLAVVVFAWVVQHFGRRNVHDLFNQVYCDLLPVHSLVVDPTEK